MDFLLTQQQKEIKEQLRAFCLDEISPTLEKMDKKAEFPIDTVKKLGEKGFMGMPYPKEWGGMGLDYVTYVMAIEEISKISPSHGVIVQTHTALSTWPIFTYGTEEQKKKYVPDMASGKKIGAFGLTEPNAGTDAAMQQTIAEDKGDHWLLNGSKIFISGGGIADIYVVMAMTDRSKGNKGISAFIVEKGTPGFIFAKNENKMGISGSTVAELIFNDCRIPKENLLGEEGKGFKVAMSSLDVGRLGIAAQALGIAEGAFEMTVDYMDNREQFGRKLSAFQAMSFEMAELKTKIDGAALLLYRAAGHRDAGEKDLSVTAAQAKLACSEVAMETTVKAVQFHGGYGYMKDLPLERYMRDAKITQIYEGTSEVMKMVISGSLFRPAGKKEPKECVMLNSPEEMIDLIKGKDIVIAGGRGIGEEGFRIIESLAGKLGGKTGASRGAVREGLAKGSAKIGLSGMKISPEVYLAVGISGMTQHMVGIGHDTKIIAVNKNEKAPIFKEADYGMAADGEEVLRQLDDML